MKKLRTKHRNDLGSVFAASVITVLGAGLICFIYAVSSPDVSPLLLALIIAPAVLFLAALVGVRWPKLGTGLEFWHSVFRSRSGADDGVDYEPRRIEPKHVSSRGQQQPITANEVREIRLLSPNTWVPSRMRKTRTDDVLD